MNLLSERVGSDGVVIGIEREPRFAAMAHAELNGRDLRNVELIVGDALDTGLLGAQGRLTFLGLTELASNEFVGPLAEPKP